MATQARTVTIKGKTANVTFADTDDWGSGFIGNVSLTNNLATALNGWTLEFDLANPITNIWGAEIVSHVGNHYVVRSMSWNGTVAAGGNVSFGFQASGGNPVLPGSFVVNGTTLSGGTTPPPPLPTIVISDATVTETGAATVNETFTLKLSAASAIPVTVAWKTVAGTAVAGTDFDAASGTVTFAAGQTTQTIVVKTHPGVQGSRSYSIQLSAPTGATIADAKGVGTIVNPPPAVPSLRIDDVSVTETGAATVNETFTVRLSAASASAVTVAWKTVAGTAVAGTDFDAASGTLTFAAGQTSKTITVKTHPGAQGSRSYSIQLSNPTGATIADATGVGTIINPPPAPKITIDDATVTETGAATVNETFTLKLSAASSTPVTVAYKTVAGTALAGKDFDQASGTVTFAAGQTTQTVTVKTHPGAQGTLTYSLELSNPTGATILDGTAVGSIVNPAASKPPVINVQDITVYDPAPTGGASGPASLLPAGYLHTSGNQIVDATGKPVKIAAVNWFGMETNTYSPQGLWSVGYKAMMDQMVQLGFNAIRLPFSDELFEPGRTPNGIDFNKSPDLKGLTGQQIMDKVVEYAGQKGLKIILDHHRSAAGPGPNTNGLWYDSGYTEAKMTANWVQLATRYANNPTVIGMDLNNEPHGPATWGDGGPNDWAAAATRMGNAVLAANPNLLIVVEGIESYQNNYDWWGGNLMGVKDHPVVLNVANRVVYSPHDYPASVYAQKWFSAPDYPNNLPDIWDKYWGFIYKTDTAPVLLGEFGTMYQTASDKLWLAKLTQYLDENSANGGVSVASGEYGPSWAYWSWNPNSGDTGGILKDDWTSVNTDKVAAITPIMYHQPDSGGSSGPVPDGTANFVITLSEASTQQVTVHYKTMDGTAHAGTDYAATQGTVVFAPGETSKIVPAQLYDYMNEPSGLQFLLSLDSPVNGTLGSVSATATVVAGNPPAPPPPPPPADGGAVILRTDSDWGSGYTSTVQVTNVTNNSVSGWTVEVDTSDLIVNLWNGTILSHTGSTYVIGNAGWNADLGAGGSTSFGFQASHTDGATLSAHLLKLGA